MLVCRNLGRRCRLFSRSCRARCCDPARCQLHWRRVCEVTVTAPGSYHSFTFREPKERQVYRRSKTMQYDGQGSRVVELRECICRSIPMQVEFWAKTTADEQPGMSVFEHMTNVGYVAHALACVAPELLTRFQMEVAEVAVLAGLHDLGKISPGFQRKCKAWLEINGVIDVARRWAWDTTMEADHGAVTHAVVQRFLVGTGMKRRSAEYLAAVLGGHHGRIQRPNGRGFKPAKPFSEPHSGIKWEEECDAAARSICELFGGNLPNLAIDKDSPGLWWLAGLTSVADWIGSDETFFPLEGRAPDADASDIAAEAVAAIGLIIPDVRAGLSFHDLFHDAAHPEVRFVPNEMQRAAHSAIIGPGVYVIEAPMGMGKTEAALWAAYQMMLDEKARGIYFALPTQATSNRIYRRLSTFVGRIAPNSVASRLIHGNSWLLEEQLGLRPAATETQGSDEDARTGRDWFASAKRALLAPFGVGTVDQALLGVVAAKHFFVRQYSLAGKVVILDEVHSYDIYTGTLIDKLIVTLEGLGCTVIILSATLTGKRRNQIVSSTHGDDPEAEPSYPLITGRNEGQDIQPIPADPPPARTVEIAFAPAGNAAAEAIALAENGGCVLWICDTVDSAQKQYEHFHAGTHARVPLGLLHSRFPFWRREQLESEWMERFGKAGDTRCGSILVSTQIVEQSVDLDADLLITELAPTDMLLQRAGRLWRHERTRPGGASCRMVILEETASLNEFRELGAKAIVNTLGGKAYVYSPYVLLRSLQVWEPRDQVTLPTDIRGLIEATYEDSDEEPDAWQKLLLDYRGESTAYRQRAQLSSNIWGAALDDVEGVQTRLNEVPTRAFVLCRSVTKTDVEFLDGSRGDFREDDFRLAVAQAIHRNLVRIPSRFLLDTDPHAGVARYLRGPQAIGVADSTGTISSIGLKDSVRLRWCNDLGLVIENTSGKEGL